MKARLFVSILILVCSELIMAQTNTFYKSYPKTAGLGGLKPSVNILQTDDNGYIIHTPTEFRFIKTDQYGYIQQIKEFPEYFSLSLKLIKTFNGGYAAVGNSILDTNSIILIKFDQNLDTIWTKSYTKNSGDESAQEILQLPDSSYIISSSDFYDHTYCLRKINPVGLLIWIKVTTASPTFFNYTYLVNLSDGNFLFWKPSSLIKMNSNGDTLWNKNATRSNFSYLTSDGYILCSSRDTLKKLDQDGNLIWQKVIINPNSITENNIGNYVCVALSSFDGVLLNRILILDNAGNQISQTDFNDQTTNIIRCDDGGLAISGRLNGDFGYLIYPTLLLKTDSNLNYTAVHLKTPADGNTLDIFNTYNITWESKNVNFVNIDYSTDNQLTWNPIIHYYPAEEDTFSWTIPEIPAGDLYIKISDSFNPDIYDRSDPPQNTTYYQMNDYIAANEIFMWQANNGMNSHDPRTDGSGFFWSGGEDATVAAIFADGLVWGGKVNGEIRVNGDTYRYGLNSGYILPSGLPSDPNETKSKMFKLKKNWQYLPASAERDRYEFDFLNWPVDVGAPWNDNNGDGVYTLGIDEPKIIGDETLFFVANDLDTLRSLYTYGSNPIGLEFQVTTFGYNSELLKDVVFKKFKIINKSNDDIIDMYLSYWTDDDLGFAGDDYAGCDTLLNLGYVYNGDNNDEGFYGTPPPAVGHLIVQSPIIQSIASDSARYGDGWKRGFKNSPLSSFVLYLNYGINYIDPNLGVYDGTIQFYNNMQGSVWDGSNFIDPNTNLPTHFCLSGDPVVGTGWYEGNGWPGGPTPEDRRFSLACGPFNMATNDTQEVAIAFLMKKGTDNINSVSVLKDYAAQIQHWYDNDFVTEVNESVPAIPTEFSLSQNYPNPFNPSTIIKYAISSRQLVTLKVYDILGSEIASLVNEEKPAGNYEVEFKSSFGSLQLASGIYFYRLQAGSFVETKKMILMK